MDKFTPGPWVIGTPPPNGELTIGNQAGMMVAVATTGFCCPTAANARLIAAAPDLLEALEETRKDFVVLRGNITEAAKSCSRWDGMPELIDAWIRRNDAAIAKARGES